MVERGGQTEEQREPGEAGRGGTWGGRGRQIRRRQH